MSNQPINDADLLDIIKNEREKYEQAAEAERQALIEQRVRELLAEERAVERQENERAADILSAEYVADPARERDRARETAKSAALLLIMLLLILLLIAAATGRTDILPIPGVQSTQTLKPQIGPTIEIGQLSRRGGVPTFPPGVTPEVDGFFQSKYDEIMRRGPECSIGNPISPGYTQDGLRYQWFERALLKEMPAGSVSDPAWAIQGEPLGRQVTIKILFPTSPSFISQPGNYYFGETGYSVHGAFLDFWLNCKGQELLGYPVSDEVNEMVMPDNKIYLVQYFERGRLELHQDDPNNPVQFGLLGSIKSKDEHFQPIVTMPANPNAPPSATPMPAPVLAATATRPPAVTAAPLPTSAATPAPATPTAPIYPAP